MINKELFNELKFLLVLNAAAKSKKEHLHNEPSSNIHITRVPGGQIYNYALRNYTVFIPYNGEFNIEGTATQTRSMTDIILDIRAGRL